MLNKVNKLYTFLALQLAIIIFSSQLYADYLHQRDKVFKYSLSSGVFSIHKKAHSVDWYLDNISSKPQQYRVTIYLVKSHNRKVISPGPLSGIIEPDGFTHNANGIGERQPFKKDRRYEIVVEVNTREVLPKVEMWRTNFGSDVIPETVIGPSRFRKIN